MGKQHTQMERLLDVSIRVELLISDLYALFKDEYEDDREFWWGLSLEEKNHAAILKSAYLYLKLDKLPQDSVLLNMNILENMADSLEMLIQAFREEPMTMQEAYRCAYALESSASEDHFQQMLASASPNQIIKIFRKLCRDESDHARRIAQLMETRGMI